MTEVTHFSSRESWKPWLSLGAEKSWLTLKNTQNKEQPLLTYPLGVSNER